MSLFGSLSGAARALEAQQYGLDVVGAPDGSGAMTRLLVSPETPGASNRDTRRVATRGA